MQDQFETMKLRPLPEGSETAADILAHVYRALQAKGYDHITQLLGFVLTGTFRLILPFAAFFGLHPIVNQLQKKFGINRWLALAIKTLWFAGVMALCYFFTSMFVFENEFLKTYGVYIVIIGGALIFPFYDAIMTRFQYSVNAFVARLKL